MKAALDIAMSAGSPAPVETTIPVLMEWSDIIDVKRAAYRANRNPKTIRTWCARYGIGRQTDAGSPLEISAPALEMLIHGDFDALDLLRDGNRTDARVLRYFEWLGLTAERSTPK